MCSCSGTGKLYRSCITVSKSVPWGVLHRRTHQTGWRETLDYIIFGLGVGATLTLIGWSFRMWGPALRDRTSSTEETVLSGYELVNRMAWQRFCRSCGAVLAMFGLLVLAVTIVATILTLSNRTGSTIVLATFVACLVATLVWLGLFLHRFGSRGIFRPPIVEPDSMPAAASREPASPDMVASQSDAPMSRGGPSVIVASGSQPDTVDVAIDTAGADTEPTGEPSDEQPAVSDDPYVETGDEVAASALEPDLEDKDILVHEEKPSEDEGATIVDPGHDGDQTSAEPSGQVERPTEEETKTGRLISRSAGGEEHPSVGLSAGPEVGTDALQDDGPETEAAVSDDQVPIGGHSGTRDDLVAEQSSAREPEEERKTPVAQPDPDVPAPSGRADAVRSLRQRRIRRLMQEPPESE